ncbi:MAG: trypsin-like peptidase domain-containing protein [Planctomycetaceae bacterium]|nr:trypsin-like peptidase domain-containing protein [Planctomycetales bacterium]MCB9873734.1 trypsin-like peptidase domain-containing protein [Planctomycetaceae bacterium]MCB9938131.1 trypsin-like peptidase domain-containing protein [Planctomycetaceae bacterium]
MPDPAFCSRRFSVRLLIVLHLTALSLMVPSSTYATSLRRSAIVQAVEQAKSSVVNIHGRKTVAADEDAGAMKQVNGMGTGIVIDPRGYIVTNFHVVDGVKQVQVSMADGTTLVARVVAHDPSTDLAVIKIETPHPMQTMTIGTSSDLMTGEEVIAIGNAYGYEHTVTRGIVSALHRTVEVGEGQEYADLIQTDASINPGNSGGPLLNIDGDMIGINVAVRVGAQGIGFAVPIDRALDVTARLLDAEVRKTANHGVDGKTLASPDKSEFMVTSVASGSAADTAGLLPGDIVLEVAGASISRALDFERAMIDKRGGDELLLSIRRGGESQKLSLVLDNPSLSERSVSELAWDVFGIRLTPTASGTFRRISTRYRGGLKVIGVRPDSPAARQGIRYGDILVGMHKWETVSMDNVAFILESDVVRANEPVKFYVLRGGETLFGHLQVSMRTE